MNTMEPKVCATGKGSLVRPQYFPGLLLEDEDLSAAVRYTRETMRLLMRSLFGCGVICGLKVTAKYECHRRMVKITVPPGVALDCAGNVIEVTRETVLTYDPKCERMPPSLWIVLCHQETGCHSTTVSCSEEETSSVVQRRVSEGYVIHVYDSQPEAVCSCAKSKHKPPRPDDARSCCPEHETADNKNEQPTSVDPCDCYKDHINGECVCACCCNCVLLGRFTLGAGEDPKPHDEEVRFVRPMLVGAMNCYGPEKVDEGSRRRPAPPVNVATAQWLWAPTIEELRWHLEHAIDDAREAELQVQRDEVRLDQRKAALKNAEKEYADRPSDETKAAMEEAQREYTKQEEIVTAGKEMGAKADADIKTGQELLKRRELERDYAAQEKQLAYVNREIVIAKSRNLDTGDLVTKRDDIVTKMKEQFERLST